MCLVSWCTQVPVSARRQKTERLLALELVVERLVSHGNVFTIGQRDCLFDAFDGGRETTKL